MTDIKIIKNENVFVIPQKDNSFKDFLGNTVNLNESPQSAILAMTNLDISRITKFELPTILTIIYYIREKFPSYNPPMDIPILVNEYINDLFSQSFWTALSTNKDCSFVKMEKRKFPYFNCADKEWKEINTKRTFTLDTYPAEFNGEIREEKAVISTSTERNNGWQIIKEKAINILQNLDEKEACSVDEIQLSKDLYHKATTKIDDVLRVRSPKEYNDSTEYNDSNYHYIQVLGSQFYPNLCEYKNFIILLCKAGLTKQATKLLVILPLTYSSCGVIKYDWFWKIWNELIFDDQFKNYVIYYSMYVLKLEELKSYNAVAFNARFIFSLEEAELISKNIPNIGIDKHALVHLMEPLGFKSSYMPFFLDSPGKRKINNMETFKQRLSIATDGLLDGIILSNFNAVLSGSILVPCVATNPLEDRFSNVNKNKKYEIEDLFDNIISDYYEEDIKNYDNSFQAYVECYYPSYKSVKNDELHIYVEPRQTENEYKIQKDEDIANNHYGKPDDIEKPIAYGILSDLDISIHTATFDEFKIQAYALFEELKKNLSDEKKSKIYIRRIKRGNNFKYSVYGEGIIRPIDLFWITKTPDTFVEQFHLGVVRMYWDGTQLRIMQSCLAALLTGINHDYRWLSCNKAPAIPVIKYAQRGYTTPLNKNERPIMVEYLSNKIEWAASLKTQAIIQENIFNIVMANNLFFMPDITNSGIRYGLKELSDSIETYHKETPKINNNRIRWIPVTSKIGQTELQYYNDSRNSIGQPSMRIIDDVISTIL